jgi:hypothetical protein
MPVGISISVALSSNIGQNARHKAKPTSEVCIVTRRLAAVLLLLCSFAYAKGSRSGSHSSAHSSKSSHLSRAGKTEHVRGYTRKDGNHVAPYDRRPSGTAAITAASYGGSTTTYHPYRRGYVAEGYTAHSTVVRDKHGRIKRSASAKHDFERQQPCPSTGKSSGRCPGYVVDHVRPLECGGVDAPSNMQLQTVASGKAKDKTEGQCRL